MRVKLDRNAVLKPSDNLSSGYDVVAIGYSRVDTQLEKIKDKQLFDKEDSSAFEIKPHETIMIHTGVYLELPEPIDMGEYVSIVEAQMRPRSGLSLKRGTNVKLGTIDNNYRGECNVIFVNDSENSVFIKPFERVAQLVFVPIVKFKEIKIVDNLNDSDRGSKGFGSTGKL